MASFLFPSWHPMPGFRWSRAGGANMYYFSEDNEKKDDLCQQVLTVPLPWLSIRGVYMTERFYDVFDGQGSRRMCQCTQQRLLRGMSLLTSRCAAVRVVD